MHYKIFSWYTQLQLFKLWHLYNVSLKAHHPGVCVLPLYAGTENTSHDRTIVGLAYCRIVAYDLSALQI